MADHPIDERVSIIVVNFNGGEKLLRCLDSMRATAPDAELIVVDNASTDGSPRLAERDGVRLLLRPENAGYAAGLNAGANAAGGDVLVFCNMDIVAREGWLSPLIACLRRLPDAGAVNPLILLSDGGHVNAAGQNLHVTGLGFNRGLDDSVAAYDREPFEVAGIQGAAYAMRRAVYEEIGGFDVTGFLYHEDVNLSWLLRLAGYRLYCVPRARVEHDYFLSMYPDKFHLLERNRVAMLLAYLAPRSIALLAPFLLVTELLAWGYSLLRGPRFLLAKWSSYRWVVRKRKVIAERRSVARRLRRVSDRQLLRAFRFRYDWRQFGVLARETGESRRKPAEALPISR
ncbi:MAG: glycosyltransferase family 2 protein [Thermoanaerobaculia bacterium]